MFPLKSGTVSRIYEILKGILTNLNQRDMCAEGTYNICYSVRLDCFMRISKRTVLISIPVLLVILWPSFPHNPNPVFLRAVKNADRIVIRNGGFNCCDNDIDSQEILYEITDPVEIAGFNANIVFEKSFDSMSVASCEYCGYPGIDWYQGGNRTLLTSVQHGKALRWSEFDGDENLTAESEAWLKQFFSQKGIPEDMNNMAMQETR